eukprot:TRINITY_DN132_c0_g1_i10.p2 TRINITY_DN132_c0_g1~~TRINITY_DN132_c0_g1_i10.p2  ORF type:complete len:215 (+),score=45.41 TRINITY_DN132_c0_g1_i10:2044-2688(+)
MSVVNYDGLVSSKAKHRNVSLLMPQWPFRLCIVGNSGSGKTNLVMNMLLQPKMLCYDRLYVVSPSLDQEKYAHLQEHFEEHDEKLHNACEKELKKKGVPQEKIDEALAELKPSGYFYDTIDDLDMDDFDKEYQNLVVLDDIMLDKNQKNYINLFSRGRHFNVSVMYLSQSFFRIPKTIRDNSSAFALFSMSPREVNEIYSHVRRPAEVRVHLYR